MFSKGMQKQVSVILGICTNTKYLLCDETFDGLDPVMRQAVKSIFAVELINRDFTPVIASHNLRELEDICDHVGLLHKGGILFSENLEDMKFHIQKVQCVIGDPVREEQLLKELSVMQYERRGSMMLLVAKGTRNRNSRNGSTASIRCLRKFCRSLWKKSSSVKRRWQVMTSKISFFKLLRENLRHRGWLIELSCSYQCRFLLPINFQMRLENVLHIQFTDMTSNQMKVWVEQNRQLAAEQVLGPSNGMIMAAVLVAASTLWSDRLCISSF